MSLSVGQGLPFTSDGEEPHAPELAFTLRDLTLQSITLGLADSLLLLTVLAWPPMVPNGNSCDLGRARTTWNQGENTEALREWQRPTDGPVLRKKHAAHSGQA